jgi:hypothetical protein
MFFYNYTCISETVMESLCRIRNSHSKQTLIDVKTSLQFSLPLLLAYSGIFSIFLSAVYMVW